MVRGEFKRFHHKRRDNSRLNNSRRLDYNRLSTDFRSPLDAVKKAAGYINHELKASDVARNETQSTDLKVVFGQGDWATTAEKMYFPTEPGVAIPAWRVLIWQPVNAYYVIVDAEAHDAWRKKLVNDQTSRGL